MKETQAPDVRPGTALPARPIPIIDLFAGPGGLGEGFASLDDGRHFEIKLSIEKDPIAHRTLRIRALYRHLKRTHDRMPEAYYDYIRGEISDEEFFALPEIEPAWELSGEEARQLELGPETAVETDRLISTVISPSDNWLLIGGPPCQAYSLVGRSRQAGNVHFDDDERHFLYQEYLRVIQKHRPAAFVMENVKGLLSSTNRGVGMFAKIRADLESPLDDLQYDIRSFVASDDNLDPTQFVIRAEEHGLPQARHRVVLLGVRRDSGFGQHELLEIATERATTKDVLNGLPPIRSRISSNDSLASWRAVLAETPMKVKHSKANHAADKKALQDKMTESAKAAGLSPWIDRSGAHFISIKPAMTQGDMPDHLWEWIHDPRIGGVIQHESRSHMAADLQRYLYAASYASLQGVSPTLEQFPRSLMPNHQNASGTNIPFSDRFRVQVAERAATTVVAHISKDGHYYIHYDPAQCRSLTVREAARLQTFPDNYFFAGSRTNQYIQVGNAVPPLLATKLARIIAKLFTEREMS